MTTNTHNRRTSNHQPGMPRHIEVHKKPSRARIAVRRTLAVTAIAGASLIGSTETGRHAVDKVVTAPVAVVDRVAEQAGLGLPDFEVPPITENADVDRYKVTIGSEQDGYRFINLASIADAVVDRGDGLDGKPHTYERVLDMLQRQNAMQQEAMGIAKEDIKESLVQPGQAFYLPADFENAPGVPVPAVHTSEIVDESGNVIARASSTSFDPSTGLSVDSEQK